MRYPAPVEYMAADVGLCNKPCPDLTVPCNAAGDYIAIRW